MTRAGSLYLTLRRDSSLNTFSEPLVIDNLPGVFSSLPLPLPVHLPSSFFKMTSNPKPHFVLVPLMAQGHMIPLVDLARLLATRGATVSFITTPINAARIKPIIDTVVDSNLPINFISLPFPCAQAGLPNGCENIDLLFSADTFKPFFAAASLLRDPLLLHLQNQHNPKPTCLISDYCHSWTMHVSQVLNIPRFIFHGPCCLYMLSSYNINKHGIYDRVTDLNEPFIIPDLLPYRFNVTRAQVPGFFGDPEWEDIRDAAAESEATSDGVVLNSFDELEPLFIEKYRAAIQKPVWAVGPLSLYNQDLTSMATRGNKASIDEHRVLGWLDSRSVKSVIYVNFGSLARTSPAQVTELGLGLEATGYAFIWVIKKVDLTNDVDEWLEGFEARTRKRGLVIKGWAPQVVILSHPAVGGFVTHCGWNSILEAVSAGVPMITWPCFADQFVNEKLVVEVLRVGITIGVTVPYFYGFSEEEVVVKKDEVEKAVAKLMDGEEEGEERRERATKLSEKAKKAMEEGGSSYENLNDLIRYV